MKIRVSILVNLMLSMVLVVSIAANLTGAVDYDPWLDVNDDGYGGIDDIVSTAEHFGASGDPAKLCNITNWPISSETNIWNGYHITPSYSVVSGFYNASGFSQLHLVAYGFGLSGVEILSIDVRSRIGSSVISISTITLTSGTNIQAITIPVPSEIFQFRVYTDATTDCYITFSFYLTWS